jgi:methionyl-tRNA synthetase
VLYTSAEALRIVTALAHPVMPEATAKIWTQLGLSDIGKVALPELRWGQLHLGTKLGKVEPAFPRRDKSAIERMQKMEDQERVPVDVAHLGATEDQAQTKEATPTATGPAYGEAEPRVQGAGNDRFAPSKVAAAPSSPAPVDSKAAASVAASDGKITIDDFAKVELRVAQVKVAEKVKGADKLLRLEVDLGTEVRQIVAGIAEAYAPEALVGRKVVIVANLAPRKLRGLESNGMIVAASLEGGKPVLVSFLEDVPVGARLK